MTGLRWGIVAPGGIANAFTRDIQGAGLQVGAVASRALERAEAFAKQYDIARAYGSYEELAADDDIDIVYIATPHPQHLEAALLMLAHGKHVLVEKAFTANARDAEYIRMAAADAGKLALEAMWTRYLPHMVRIREILAAGTIGDVRALVADHTQLLSSDPEHRLNNLELGGGALLDLGIYPISFAWDLFGAPERIIASGELGATGADDQAQVTLHYPGGKMASTYFSKITKGANTAVILGEKGSIQIDPVWYTATSFRVVANDGTVLEEYVSDIDGRGMQFQAIAAEELVAAGNLTGGNPDVAESVLIMQTLDEVRSQLGVVFPQD